MIPVSRMDPVGRSIANLYPAPNVDGAASRNNNFRSNQPVTNPGNTMVGRIDYSITPKTRIYGRALLSWGFTEESPVYPTPGTDDFHFKNDNSYYNWSATGLHNLTPTTILEVRYTRDRRKFHAISGHFIEPGAAAATGIQGTDTRFFPRVSLTGLAVFGRGQHLRIQEPIVGDHLTGTVTKIAGRHTLKFGGEFRNSRNDDEGFNLGGGSFGFNPNATGDALAALLLGWTNNASRQEAPLVRSLAAAYGLFAQTDWRVTNRLTLNLGLRWDLDVPRHEGVNNKQNSFDRGLINPACNCPGALIWSGRNGVSQYAHNFDYNNFGPRVGFAWRATDRWVVRGGAAIIYAGQYDQASPLSANIGFGKRGDFTSPDAGRTPAFLLKDGIPPIPDPSEADLVPELGAVAIGQNPVLSPEFFETENRRVAYLQTFNFNIQRQLGYNMVAEIGYIGTLGHKLTVPGSRPTNQVHPDLIRPGNVQTLKPFPQYSEVNVLQPTIGNSNYHGVNFRLEKRYSAGIQFTSNYTWSKQIDDVESRNELGGNAGNNAFSNFYDRTGDRGLAGNHVGHRWIASVVWELPYGRGRRYNGNAFLRAFIGNWTVSTIVEARSGSPFGVIENNGAAIYPTAATVRSDATKPYAANPNFRDNVLGENYFDISGFAAPRQFTFGNLGRTVAIGPGAFISDLSFLKDFFIGERHRIQFRTEMLNFTNHANFALPNQQRGNANFGTIRDLAPGNQARIIQFGLHYKF